MNSPRVFPTLGIENAEHATAPDPDVAADLRARGWRLERVLFDNGSEFPWRVFGETVRELGARQTFIRAGRPATNAAVERVQRTILEECRATVVRSGCRAQADGLTGDLAACLRVYNVERRPTPTA
jgi:transposase InsO family protein